MKNKVSYILLQFAFLCLLGVQSPHAAAQTLTLLNSTPVDRFGTLSIDRLHNIYVSDRRNNVFKLDSLGNQLQVFSPPTQGHLALIEAWNVTKILLFYDDRQQVTILDRFLTPISSTRLSDITEGGIIKMATISNDDRIWFLNESDFTLSKFDIRFSNAASRAPLNQILNPNQNDIRFMREYQNNLYIVDRLSGIYIFDNMGNYKKRLPLTGLSYLGFKGDEGYYLKDGQLVFFNLYTQQQRTFNLPANKPYLQALVGDSFLYLVSGNSLDLYKINK
ncbi:hypothetical protein [Adhaeribacter aquaticus]|uniref:hypothetical protein n=1 Tax=Adhaeribacter aquaticus TaxID=299567 RepID=UPI0012F7A2FD|nr:hypothetical protein [Adhaeribacter aquaticus]